MLLSIKNVVNRLLIIFSFSCIQRKNKIWKTLSVPVSLTDIMWFKNYKMINPLCTGLPNWYNVIYLKKYTWTILITIGINKEIPFLYWVTSQQRVNVCCNFPKEIYSYVILLVKNPFIHTRTFICIGVFTMWNRKEKDPFFNASLYMNICILYTYDIVTHTCIYIYIYIYIER